MEHTLTLGARAGRIALGTLALLLIPLIAMWLGTGVDWTLSDFIVAGLLLFVTGMLLDTVARKAGRYRLLGIAAIVLLFLWLWAELAVGVFTHWGS
jgi:hypothetical protein